MEKEVHQNLAQVEQARQKLEDQISKLRKSLQYWQTWEAEYDGFKGELETLDQASTSEDIIELASNFGGTTITEKEIKELLSFGHGSQRSHSQLLDTISKRVETGQKNADSITKQLDQAELEYDRLNSPNGTSTALEEKPVMEIYEELDDQGNVVSSRLINANEDTSALHATLGDDSRRVEPSDISRSASQPLETKKDAKLPLPSGSSVRQSTAIQPPTGVSGLKKPGLASLGGQRIYELDEDEKVVGSSIIPPITSTTDDIAQHRAEFLENANHLGPVVATMDLDDDIEFSDTDYLDEDEIDDEDEADRRIIGYGAEDLKDTGWEMDEDREEFTQEYIKEMETLMRKYNEPVMTNVGPRDVGFPLAKELNPPVSKSNPPLHQPKPVEATKSVDKPAKVHKGVRFAENLDIAADSSASTDKPVEKTTIPFRSKASTSNSILSDIVERAPAPTTSTEGIGGNKKISRFKASRGG